MRYASRRQYDWSAAIAYSVGLMASDGCLQRDGRHLDLTSVDIEQVENFAKALGRSFYIGRKKSGTDTWGYRVQVRHHRQSRWLDEYGHLKDEAAPGLVVTR